MSFKVSYIYDLVDKLSPQLRKIQGNLQKTANAAKKSASVFSKSTDKIKAGASRARMATNGLLASTKNLIAAYVGFQGARMVVSTLADFETAISKVRAVTKASNVEMVELKKTARDLGSITQFTAGQVADGMAFLGMAGFTTNQILKSTAAVLDIAAAGQLDLGTAADISSNILTGFNLKAEEMVRVADTMAIAAASANTNIFQLGDAMKFVAPVAAGAGIDIEKAAAAIGVLSDSGLQGTMAGTGLRRIISELASPTAAATKELAKLGLKYSDINPQTNDLVDILAKLKPLAKDTGAAFRVFGDRGAPAFQVLAAGIPKLESLTEKMKSGKGAAEAMAKTMRDNLGGDIKALYSSIEAVTLSTGEGGLTGSLRGATQGLTLFFRALSGAEDSYKKLGEFGKLMINTLNILATLLKTIGIGIEKVSGAINYGINGLGKLLRDVGVLGQQSSVVNNNIAPQQSLINQRSNVGGQIEILLPQAPKGTSTKMTPMPKSNTQFSLGGNTNYYNWGN